MTREEAVIHIGTLRTVTKDIPKYSGKAIDDALDMAIKALEQTEPEKCGDCISREEFERRIKPYNTDDPMDKALYNFAHNKMIDCPSVEPERKPGKWIWDKRTGTYHCSECGHDPLHEDVGEIEEYKYCMNCGAEMEVDE